MQEILERYPMAVPEYYLSLIDREDPNDPIRRMCIPSLTETDMSGEFDTSGEADNTVQTGLQHKYAQTGADPFHKPLCHVLQTLFPEEAGRTG